MLRAEEGGSYAQVTHSIGKKGGALTLQSRNQIRYENDPKAKETYIQMNGKEDVQLCREQGTGGCEGASFPRAGFL